ncbi:spidroin-2-like [Ovis canadensis]|uniref:spidroin-2-like n=1 Tax=Ovis canadensis TaxID=37174 RepID=UPI003753B803
MFPLRSERERTRGGGGRGRLRRAAAAAGRPAGWRAAGGSTEAAAAAAAAAEAGAGRGLPGPAPRASRRGVARAWAVGPARSRGPEEAGGCVSGGGEYGYGAPKRPGRASARSLPPPALYPAAQIHIPNWPCAPPLKGGQTEAWRGFGDQVVGDVKRVTSNLYRRTLTSKGISFNPDGWCEDKIS